MTYKQRETSREIRLWIGQVIVPAATAAVIVMTNPEIRQKTVRKVNQVKNKIQNKFKRD